MPPSQSPMAFFQRRGAAVPYLQRLTKLYNDTKQSYESARVTAAESNIDDDPDVKALRRDFQIQQDRLLAWGMHFADVEAQYQQGQDVDIDKKIDQAGLGEVVAGVMSQIKSLLDQSGRLQHPEKYEMARSGLPPSPNLKRKEWNAYEVKTGRTLLEQLTTCIDVLYSLSDSRRAEETIKEKSEKPRGLEDDLEDHLYGRKHATNEASHQLFDHPLHLQYDQIDFEGSGSRAQDPPPYDAPQQTLPVQARMIGFSRAVRVPVMVEFMSADHDATVIAAAEDIFELHELGEKLCRHRKTLSWYGHLRLLGFTVHPANSRCGLVYELPSSTHVRGSHRPHFHPIRSLREAISATHEHELTQPALEDKFRLAYNVLLSVLGYFANGDSHRHVTPSNILLIGSNEQRQFPSASSNRPDIRSPHLFQSTQDFVSQGQHEDDFHAAIHRHPAHNRNNPATVVPAYDIYSLGLILLEIGLWMPLEKLWKPKYDRHILLDRLQNRYTQKLPSKVSSKYMRLVQRCLHAPDELADRTRPDEAGAHLLEIAKELRQCLALDEEGMPPTSDIECMELLIIEEMCKNDNDAEKMDTKGLPPLQIPGAFDQAQESGITKSGVPQLQPDIVPTEPVIPRRHSKRRQCSVPKLQKWPELQIAQPDLDQWNTLLMPRLSKILQETLEDSPESCSVSLMKIGKSVEAAKTTICIQCANTAKVHDALRRRFRPKKGWGVVILKGDVRRSAHHGHRRGPRRSVARKGDSKPKEQKYQEKPSCGASIGAFRDNEHLPPVSFGGTILVDGEPFGMTVHHMLDAPTDDEDASSSSSDEENEKPKRSAAARPQEAQDLQFMQGSSSDLRHFSDLDISDDDALSLSDTSDSDSDASTIRPDYSITDSNGNEFWFLDDNASDTSAPDLEDDTASLSSSSSGSSSSSSSNSNSAMSIGDRPAIHPDKECSDLMITQPALDDVDSDFFPSAEDKDDDHLASHTFGYIHASSGIRRVMHDDVKHEVDWALIRIEAERLDIANLIPEDVCSAASSKASSPRRHPHKRSDRHARARQRGKESVVAMPKLTKITPHDGLAGLPVECRARSSGYTKGRIGQAMCLVKLKGRRSFSVSWSVEGVAESAKGSMTAAMQGEKAGGDAKFKGCQQKSSSAHHRTRSGTVVERTSKTALGVPGDSGAWIYDPQSGELCGHVLAYSSKMKQAYIAPMSVIFEDIRRKLGAGVVGLPGGVEVSEASRRTVTFVDQGVRGGNIGVGNVKRERVEVVGREMLQRQQERMDSGVDLSQDERLEEGIRELRLGVVEDGGGKEAGKVEEGVGIEKGLRAGTAVVL